MRDLTATSVGVRVYYGKMGNYDSQPCLGLTHAWIGILFSELAWLIVDYQRFVG